MNKSLLGVRLEPLDELNMVLLLILSVKLFGKLEHNLMVLDRESLVIVSPGDWETHWT